MAISLDALRAKRHATPPAAPRAMPEQALDRIDKVRFRRTRFATLLARLVTFGGAAALTAYACHQMILIVSLGDVTALQGLFVALFTISFGWIALAGTGAVAGALFGGGRRLARDGAKLSTRTALLMPVYNEDPASTFALLRAMGEGLIDRGIGAHFEIFVISDTTNPDVWVRETAAFQALRETFGERLDVWYRRRHRNTGKKAGNVHDFVTRWGARYDHMIVLDADSLLSAEALETLALEMEADPECGILQSLPQLYGASTLFGRLQQFAGAVYGPIVARGITAWQGDDGNYWGHNAIIRIDAFAAAAGLPKLPGRKPFGGEIMSHDFVEAALVRRAGWNVRMLPGLIGSWEESPPSLLDVAVRDRRWAQGNLQHLAVLRTRGLRWPNRAHMLIGVMSYLASPIWLALIVVGLVITAHAASAEFDYFTEEFQLFPNWPVFDSERMVTLFVVTMTVLILPKLLGLVRALFDRRLRRGVGIIPLIVGVPLETAFSVLYAPIFMLIQSQQVFEILRGHDSGWNTQQRTHRATDWRLLFSKHAWHMVVGILVTVLLAYVSLPLLAWMSPTLIGLIFAVPLSALSGSVLMNRMLRGLRLLRIPEEKTPPPEIERRERFEPVLREQVSELTFESLLRDARLSDRHFAAATPPPRPARGEPDLARAGASLKIAEAAHWGEALTWFSPHERMAVLCHGELFAALVATGRERTAPSAGTDFHDSPHH